MRHSRAKRDYRKYESVFNKYADGDQQARRELTDHGFKLLPNVFWGLPNIQQFDLPKPDTNFPKPNRYAKIIPI